MTTSSDPETCAAGPQALYRNALRTGRFEIQKCEACGRHVFYPRVLCPHCGSGHLAWVAASGVGTVYSTTVVRRNSDGRGDYNVALIDLQEGPRLMSSVVGLAADQIRIGMKVRARIDRAEDRAILMFEPADLGA